METKHSFVLYDESVPGRNSSRRLWKWENSFCTLVKPESIKGIDVLEKFDEARESMKYMNDLCAENGQEYIYPDPYDTSNRDIYIISHQYENDIMGYLEDCFEC